MKFIISGKNIEVTPALKEMVIKKIGRLEKFFHPNTEVKATMSVEKMRHILEVTISSNGLILRAEESTGDMYTSIDKVVDVIERQIIKNKTRLEKKLKAEAIKAEDVSSFSDIDEENDFRVVRSKKFAIKPMTVEEAILQMNLLGHQFFMFSNSETNQVNLVYKRKDGDYGLIEPES
ncbi:MAG TPA: ribosome-associated translation inhibitor RaiA [Pseudobacteroides sp.]|mgnify:FL=1|nr:ribosome-associated translation inhibitor RaiA [Pseudobacteroides sp.]